MAKHIVIAVEPVDFMDDNGERIQGAKVHYLQDEPEDAPNAKGHLPLNLFLKGDPLGKFRHLPGVYELNFGQRRDKQGKPITVLRDVECIEEFSLPTF